MPKKRPRRYIQTEQNIKCSIEIEIISNNLRLSLPKHHVINVFVHIHSSPKIHWYLGLSTQDSKAKQKDK
jgi:hypothetical protein